MLTAFHYCCQAVESDHTDAANVQTVARILAGLVTAAESDVGSLMGQLEAGICHETRLFSSCPNRSHIVKDAASDSLQHEVGIAKIYMFDTGFRTADFHQAVESEHTDDANVETVARVLAGLVTSAESDVGSQEAVMNFCCLPMVRDVFLSRRQQATASSMRRGKRHFFKVGSFGSSNCRCP